MLQLKEREEYEGKKEKKKMICTLTLNPSLDYIVTVDHFRVGATNRTSDDFILPGGKGINVSIVLQNMGLENRAYGFLAGFTGTALESMVREAGIQAEFLWVKEGDTRINVKLRSDEETEINGRGPKITTEDVEKLMSKLDGMKEGDTLIISGAIPASLPQTLYREIMERLEGRGIRIVVDATRELLLNVLPLHPFLIKPNQHEIEEMFDVKLNSLDDIEKYARMLQERGAVNVLVSMGGDGALLLDENGKRHYAPAPKGTLKNSVGAGDSMVAGFVTGYLNTKDYGEAFRTGVCTGSASAFSDLLATREEVEALMAASADLFD